MAEPLAPPSTAPAVEEPVPPTASLAAPPSLGDDWPKQATDAVVKVVDAVRDKTTGPAVNAAHALKYGIVAGILAVVLAIVALIGLMRFSEAFLQKVGEWTGWSFLAEPMYLVYLLYGAVFSFGGLLLWRKANRPAKA